ncbi:MAG: CRISPR-associated protein Cas2 [Clostridia bacterium]|nr:CRISPR-associated protein Cas2 [Clostridia bacterium]
MKSMIITYDLCGSGKNYDALIEKIKSYGTWAHITESSWFIKTGASCSTVRDSLASVMDADDKLFVAELTGVAAWRCLDKRVSDYLMENL